MSPMGEAGICMKMFFVKFLSTINPDFTKQSGFPLGHLQSTRFVPVDKVPLRTNWYRDSIQCLVSTINFHKPHKNKGYRSGNFKDCVEVEMLKKLK